MLSPTSTQRALLFITIAASSLAACGTSAPPPTPGAVPEDGGTPVGADAGFPATADAGTPPFPSTDAGDATSPADGGTPIPGVGTGAHYYVSAAGDDHDSGTSPNHAWATIGKVNAMALKPGDTVHLSGKLMDREITDQTGSATAYVVFQGDGTAVIKGIHLRKSEYAAFVDLEASGPTGIECGALVTIDGAGPVQHVVFSGLHLHDSDRGIGIGNHTSGVVGNDLSFERTTIANMQCEGAVLDDYTGDRITFDGGSFSNTGIHCPWHADGSGCHGIYASGGHGHVIHGVSFSAPNKSWDVSMRRGNTTVSDCSFRGDLMLENCNEDETAYHGFYYVLHNTFTGPGTAIYQGGDNDQGIPNPENTWSIDDNTFDSGEIIDFADDSAGYYAYDYDVYMCNNTLNGADVRMGSTAAGVTHDPNAAHCPAPP